MAQHSSTAGFINMQWRQLQGSSQYTNKDNDTDLFYNYGHEMPLCEVEHLESLYMCSVSWCQRVVRISCKEEITYSDRTQEYSASFKTINQ